MASIISDGNGRLVMVMTASRKPRRQPEPIEGGEDTMASEW